MDLTLMHGSGNFCPLRVIFLFNLTITLSICEQIESFLSNMICLY